MGGRALYLQVSYVVAMATETALSQLLFWRSNQGQEENMVDRITREDAILQAVKEIAIAEGKVVFNNNAKPTVDRKYLLTLIQEVSAAFDGAGASRDGVHIGLPES